MHIHQSPDVVVVLNADDPNGRQIVQILVRNGHRVAISGRYATDLTRMLHGYNTDQVMAIAADVTDPHQLRELCRRAADRFGTVTTILDANGRQMPHLRLAS
ncbi:SDR family NAD(P)-dependent oxidoreductase [Mycobacterium sp. CBMA271]|uniref:SDR family NAD(P)-dependent oxidoreductase n=1 Tax=unclassified Mycobacteroides TaxID=2618759 RepID=UPI0012DE7570|nr:MULTISPECIES: SDR family NAD(P)-dependent oxidoreductase [unclassified Mycobacteroides]MUM17553.1 short-chain dehydrogenase [Mycobacteroides sp. CBMA 326]MUM24652.1 SDR family NAD(P)-dependent oxidoreductase [Mycobacteroides sp. CBMA 271]